MSQLNFAFNYGVTPWVENTGYQNAFIGAGVIAFVTTIIFLPMIKYGKKLRIRFAPAYWLMVEESRI